MHCLYELVNKRDIFTAFERKLNNVYGIVCIHGIAVGIVQ